MTTNNSFAGKALEAQARALNTHKRFNGHTALQCEGCDGHGHEVDAEDDLMRLYFRSTPERDACEECRGLGFVPCRECPDDANAADIELQGSRGAYCVGHIDLYWDVDYLHCNQGVIERMTDAGKAWLAAQTVEELEVRPLDIRALLEEAEAYADGNTTLTDVPAIGWDDVTERGPLVEYQVSKNPTNDNRLTMDLECVQ